MLFEEPAKTLKTLATNLPMAQASAYANQTQQPKSHRANKIVGSP
jgi:hypothetical protein